MNSLLDLFRTAVVPGADQFDGFCGLSLLRDPATGTSVTWTTFKNRAALDASREAAASMGPALSALVPFEVIEVAEFEVVLAQLRVPETV